MDGGMLTEMSKLQYSRYSNNQMHQIFALPNALP